MQRKKPSRYIGLGFFFLQGIHQFVDWILYWL